MTILDELSGFEFEDTMEQAFKKQGYQNVRQTPKTGDEGRDILMEETVNGRERAIVVECKHQSEVGRPVVQKLHSAILSYDYPGPTRGMIVTSGRFSPQAKDHAAHIENNVDGTPIELIDGAAIQQIGETLGMNLRNGNFELLGDQTLLPIDPAGDIETPVGKQLDTIANIDAHNRPASTSTIRFQPVVSIQALTESVCETSSKRVLRRLTERDEFLLDGTQTPPDSVVDSLRDLLTTETPQMVPLADWQNTEVGRETTVEQFSQSENEYTEWTVNHLQSKHAETITYTGRNNVEYEHECVPDNSDISITLTPMYVPRVRSQVQLQEYEYTFEYDAAGAVRQTIENELAHCVHCGWSWLRLTYCENCGAIACWRHTKTERFDDEPICTGCAVTARFGLRKRYFFDEANRDAFREKYDERALSRQLLENWPWIVSMILVLIGLLGVLLM